MSQVDNLDSDRESIGDMATGALRDILFEVCLVLARTPAMDTLTSRLTTLAALGSVNTDLRAFVQEVAMPEIQRREVHPAYYDDHQRLRKPRLMDLAMMTNDELERLSLAACGLVNFKPQLRDQNKWTIPRDAERAEREFYVEQRLLIAAGCWEFMPIIYQAYDTDRS